MDQPRRSSRESVRYRTVLCAVHAISGDLRPWPQCGDVVNGTYICEIKVTGAPILLGETTGILQAGVTFAYTINPFGPSAWCTFIIVNYNAFSDMPRDRCLRLSQ